MAGRASDRKNKNAMLQKCRLSAVATPNREKPKERKEDCVLIVLSEISSPIHPAFQ